MRSGGRPPRGARCSRPCAAAGRPRGPSAGARIDRRRRASRPAAALAGEPAGQQPDQRPALPTSIAWSGARRRAGPGRAGRGRRRRSSTSAPSAARRAAWTACPRRAGSCRRGPGAADIARHSAARCESDLSGGAVTVPAQARRGPEEASRSCDLPRHRVAEGLDQRLGRAAARLARDPQLDRCRSRCRRPGAEPCPRC